MLHATCYYVLFDNATLLPLPFRPNNASWHNQMKTAIYNLNIFGRLWMLQDVELTIKEDAGVGDQ